MQFSELPEDILRELSGPKPAAGAWNAAYPRSPPPAHKQPGAKQQNCFENVQLEEGAIGKGNLTEGFFMGGAC